MMADFLAPTDEQVQAALRRLTSFQLRRAFYEGLKNPLWVKPLAVAGAFSSPPEPEVGSDGLVRERYWPEAGYLDAMAEQVPAEVAEVLRSLVWSNNSWVRRTALSAGSRMPAETAATLKPVIDAWAETGYGWRTDPRDLVSFAVNLLEGGKTRFGVSFANKLFRPTGKSSAGDVVAGLEPYWYSRELPRISRALGVDALKSVLPWLSLYEEYAGSVGADHDHSGFGRSLISQGHDSHHEIQDALIDAVRDAAIDQLGKDPANAWVRLNRKPILVVRRISLYSVSEVLKHEAAQGGVSPDLLNVARELMVDAKSRNQYAVPDFIRLLCALGAVAPGALDHLTGVLASGHLTEREAARITGNLRERGESDEEIQRQIEQWDRAWRHRVLAGVGRDLLPTVLREELDRLDDEEGVVGDPMRPPFQNSGWIGSCSPISQEEMAALAPMELLAQLEGWHDPGDGLGPEPSHAGQARVLEAVVTNNPLALRGQQELVRRLRPEYLRGVLRGWEGALKANLDLPFDDVLSIVAAILDHSNSTDYPAGGRTDDDPDLRETKKVAIWLLVQLGPKHSVERLPDEHLSLLAELLLAAATGTSAWEDYISTVGELDAERDPLMISLNWRWPVLLRGLVFLVALGPDHPWHARAVEALHEQLSLEDPQGASRAVLGEGLGRLFNNARDWLEKNLSTYFGTRFAMDRNQQVALTTAIAMHYYHPALYRLLSGPMIAAIQSREQVSVGWANNVSPQQRIGQWIIEAIIRGDIGHDDRLRTEFYTQAAPDIRGDAIGHTAWSFMHAEAVDDAIRDRLAALWDERVLHVGTHPNDRAELKGFYWFIRSERFPASWWLPRLVRALELDGDLDTHGMIGEQLAAAANEFPRLALEALTMLLRADETSDRDNYDLRTHSLAPVIAAARGTSDERLHADALALTNRMGERGEIDLDKRVSALLADGSQ